MLNEQDRKTAEKAGILEALETLRKATEEIDNADGVTFDLEEYTPDTPLISVALKHHTPENHYLRTRARMLGRFLKAAANVGFEAIGAVSKGFHSCVVDEDMCCYFQIQPKTEAEEQLDEDAPTKDNAPLEEAETPEMYIEQIALQERLDRLREGLCAHQEYYAAEIYRFANLPISTYLNGNAEELKQLACHMNISCDELRAMTYKQVARDITDKIYHDCDTFWCSAGEVLIQPLIRAYTGQTEDAEKDAPLQGQNKSGRISLDERLKDSFTLESFAFPSMDVASFMLYMDELVDSGGWGRFEVDYLSNLQQFGDHTIASLVTASEKMTEKQREDIYYYLLIKPFGWLDEYPRNRWIPK